SQSKHPAEAAAFVNFMINTEDAADILKTERGITENAAIQKHLESVFTPQYQAAADYVNALTPGPAPVVTPNGGSNIEAILQRYTQEVLFEQTSPKDAAKSFINELQGEIDAAK
ncbi:hypothetical protein ACC691_36785, partial [Rhizobium johnstonii]|uniref:hypothetical protein n=1 Tax=Rhizobium johnstonii TaxID=3019933 RepID=UPI003F9B9006